MEFPCYDPRVFAFMKIQLPAVVFPAFAASLALVSCASINQAGKSSLALVQKTSAATTSQMVKLSDMSVGKILPARVKVVDVREKDLKELPTGQERALAFEKTRRSGFWIFGGPIDFKEPELPLAGTEMDGSLLPPKAP